MLVAYEKTVTVFINPRILEEYYEIENAEKLTKEEMSKLFSEIPVNELIDLCEDYVIESEVEKI
jgi:5'-3' exonuclease